jgi:hypothetical protein
MSIHPFDLQARAKLAAQALTRLRDPARAGLMYFLANWRARPPRAEHGLWDCGDGSGRHVDALTLARTMLRPGSPAAQPDEGESQTEAWMLRLLGDDGLSWLPVEPWAAPWEPSLLMANWTDGTPIAEISWAQRGTLLGLVSRYRQTGDERYLSRARRMVDELLRIAVRHPDGLLFPEGYYRPIGWQSTSPDIYPGIEEYNAAVAWPALRLYEAAQHEPALELAEGLIRFALKHTRGYAPDGALQKLHGGLEDHFHTRSNFMLAVLKLGLLAGRAEYVSWARQGYEHAKLPGTEFGFFPEGLSHRHGEICCTTDMIELALLLGRHVDRAYYADAERFGRNHLLESQLLSLHQLQHALALMPEDTRPPAHEGRYSTQAHVAESQVGSFASRPTLNDAFHVDAPALMQCCSAAGTRGLYDLWSHAIEYTPANGDKSAHCAVHLRFSVETPHLRVVSHEPAAGQLDVTPRQDCELSVRLPAGAAHALVVIRSQSEPDPRVLKLTARNGYVQFLLCAADQAEINYALPERRAHYEVGPAERSASCTGHWRGETLMRVEPAGTLYPLYQRPLDLPPVIPVLPEHDLIESL